MSAGPEGNCSTVTDNVISNCAAFVGNSALQPVREAKLLASLPLCTSFFSDSNDIMTIDSRGTYTPTYPTNERLVVITLCRIWRKALPRSPPPQGPGRHIPMYRPPNPPIYDENGVLVPLIKANSARGRGSLGRSFVSRIVCNSLFLSLVCFSSAL